MVGLAACLPDNMASPSPTNAMQRAQDILENTFGYDRFRLNQAQIVESLIEGHDTFALMPTGGGKSLCYQIPAMVREGVGVVISPLIALMEDQVNALQQLGIKAAFLNSTLDAFSAREIEQRLLDQQLDLLYISPERLVMPRMQDLLKRSKVSLFAIDEAHCVSQWGHDFRQDYRQLGLLTELFPEIPKIALTATADPRTQNDIIEQLRLKSPRRFVNSFDRPNLFYRISDGDNARSRLWKFIQENHSEDAGIVYCLSRKNVEAVAEWLGERGRVALPYHAGLSSELRSLHQKRFLREEGVIIVATIAFGMGIDKPDVRFVAHLNLPKSLEAYYQETGRAGRDGKPANTWMSYSLRDVVMLRQMVDESQAETARQHIERDKLNAMLGLCEMVDCRRQAILAYFGENLPEPCGQCDNCVSPPETRDATEDAQKALSCIYRAGQRFGMNYIIDLLTGSSDERINSNGHNQLSTFGIGKNLNKTEWRHLFRQLVAKGLVRVDDSRHGALVLTDACRPLLRGEQSLETRKSVPETGRAERKQKKTELPEQDMPLWNALRSLRRELADEQGVPPYVIFSDASLLEMVQKRPADSRSFRYITGVGDSKLERYGTAFLRSINTYPRPKYFSSALSNTVNDTLACLAQGDAINEIAQQRGLTIDTVYNHLATAIEAGSLALDDAISIPTNDLEEITTALQMHQLGGPVRLSEVFNDLGGSYDYGLLRCVQAHLSAS